MNARMGLNPLQRLTKNKFISVRLYECQKTHQKYVVKKLKKEFIKQEEENEIISQAEQYKNLEYPNMAGLHEVIENDKYFFLISEYFQNGSLQDEIKRWSNITG